jgi:hypothetical protein
VLGAGYLTIGIGRAREGVTELSVSVDMLSDSVGEVGLERWTGVGWKLDGANVATET